MLGLPQAVRVCLFDLDGVLTDTASVHRRAWGDTFDPLLAARGLPPFTEEDYDEYVDGKPRLDGVRDFLSSRGIHLPEGGAGDAGDAATVHGVAARKNTEVLARIHRDGVTVYDGSRQYLQAAASSGLRRVVVSSSANTAEVLAVTGLDKWVEDRIDGVVLEQRHIRGKPAADSFLAGAALVGAGPEAAAVFEDAVAGVEAGHHGGFGFVVGVNRLDDAHGRELARRGANVVVRDLAELL